MRIAVLPALTPGRLADTRVLVQARQLDPQQPGGVACSNGLELIVGPWESAAPRVGGTHRERYTTGMKPARRVLMVLGHGRTESLCHHLTEVARATLVERGAEVRLHDLLADGFDPRLRLTRAEEIATPPSAEADPLVHRYCEDVRWAEAFVVVHPVWWFAPPAILKGWIDRVFVHSVAVNQPAEGPPEGILQGRRALVVQTFNAPRAVDTLLMRNLSEAFWKRAVFSSVGVRDVKRLAYYGVVGIAGKALAAAEQRLRRAVAALT